jgi:hypothetical protein
MRDRFVALVLVIASAGCPGGSNPAECTGNSDCNLRPGGVCIEAPSGRDWCAYPSGPECPSGLVWSETAGDGLAGECVVAPDGGPIDAGTPDAAHIDSGPPDAADIDAAPQIDAGPNDPPVSMGQAADLVIGQPGFTTGTLNQGGESASSLARPTGITTDGTRLWIGDASNGRVLQFNVLPLASMPAADVVIGQESATSHVDGSPTASTLLSGSLRIWASSADGTHLCVTDRGRNRVLIWKSVQTANGQPADLVLGQSSFTTSVSGNSSQLLLSPRGVYCDGQRVIVADNGNSRVLIWSTWPTMNGQAADVVLGRPDFDIGTETPVADPPTPSSMRNPDGVSYDGTRLYVADTLNHRVMVWSSLPTINGSAADYFIGQIDGTHGDTDNGMAGTNSVGLANPTAVIAADGHLYIADPGNSRVLVYTNIPTTSGTPADVALGKDALNEGTLPITPAVDLIHTPRGLAIAGDKLFVTDSEWNRVLRFDLNP